MNYRACRTLTTGTTKTSGTSREWNGAARSRKQGHALSTRANRKASPNKLATKVLKCTQDDEEFLSHEAQFIEYKFFIKHADQWSQSSSRICESNLPQFSPKFSKSTLLQCEHHYRKFSEKYLHELSRRLSEFSFSCTVSLYLQLSLCQETEVAQLCSWVRMACVHGVRVVEFQPSRELNICLGVELLFSQECIRCRNQIDTTINKNMRRFIQAF